MESLVMRRILKLEPKNRIKTNPRIEAELLHTMEREGFDLSNTMNIALEKHLLQKGVTIGTCEGVEA